MCVSACVCACVRVCYVRNSGRVILIFLLVGNVCFFRACHYVICIVFIWNDSTGGKGSDLFVARIKCVFFMPVTRQHYIIWMTWCKSRQWFPQLLSGYFLEVLLCGRSLFFSKFRLFPAVRYLSDWAGWTLLPARLLFLFSFALIKAMLAFF